MTDMNSKKGRASAWFKSLQSQLMAAFEELERDADLETLAGYAGFDPGSFEKTPWSRGGGEEDQGGGVMGMLRGRVFEKAGIHFSEVHGEFSEEFRAQIPGAADDPKFWACGVSLIAHPRNPHVPAALMNTRMIVTTKQWFGGGGDLNPMLAVYRTETHEDTVYFHDAYRRTCDRHDKEYYPKFKKWCDDYFYLPHRDEPRGVGGIFYDRHNSGDWEADFAFTQDVGKCFLETYPALVKRRMRQPWDSDDVEAQLHQRGRYAEYNLLYDRGTTFGLKTGGNVTSILSSLPPLASWR